MPTKKLQVFISSTYKDLIEERQAAVAAILKAGHIPAGMELFTAGDESQWETITRWIDESDVFMLILGGRYGSTHPKTKKGYTEMEYDYAISKDKPFFVVAIDEQELDARVKDRGTDVLELDNRAKLAAFRKKVLKKMCSFFRDPRDIRLTVHEVIPGLAAKYELPGWISGREVTDNKPLIDEMAKLSDENRDLRKQLDRLQKQVASFGSSDAHNDFRVLIDLLNAFEVELPPGISRTDKASKKVSIFHALTTWSEKLVNGLDEPDTLAGSQLDKFLFYSVCPSLVIHELGRIQHHNFSVTAKGKKFLAFTEMEAFRASRQQSQRD